jgi:hypothetical protein
LIKKKKRKKGIKNRFLLNNQWMIGGRMKSKKKKGRGPKRGEY